MDKPSIALIGAGKVGSTLALALSRAGCRVAAVVDPDTGLAKEAASAAGAEHWCAVPGPQLEGAEAVIVAVTDAVVARTAEKLADSGFLRPGQAILHTSGMLASSELAPAKARGCHIGSMHPMLSVAERLSALPQGPFYFGIEGDPEAAGMARRLVLLLGGTAVDIDPDRKVLYHAACVLAAGMTAGLLGLSRKLFDGVGTGGHGLGMARSLAASASANAMRLEPAQALTGPMARGDAEAVARHLAALQEADPAAAEAYRALGRVALGMLGEGMEEGVRSRLKELLEAE